MVATMTIEEATLGVGEMESQTVGTTCTQTIDIPKTVPFSIEDLRELTDRITANIHNAPRGAKTFVEAANQYMYHHAFLNPVMGEIAHALAYMNGDRGTGVSKKRKTNSVRVRARKFYDSLGEPALRKHCALYNLSYEAFESAEDRINALVEKSIELM